MFSNLKALVIPEGEVAKIEANGVVIWELPSSYTNRVSLSIDTDGSIFNGTGYQDNTRVRSGGNTGSYDNFVATGCVPVKAGDVVRFNCDAWDTKADNGNCINIGYISNGAFTSLGCYTTGGSVYGNYSSAWSSYKATKEKDNIWKLTIPPNASITHIRLSCYGKGKNLTVTVNEEIN